MSFGSIYAAWLTLIHSEWAHPWDPTLFRWLGLGTVRDGMHPLTPVSR
jgi:hypothetical protein